MDDPLTHLPFKGLIKNINFQHCTFATFVSLDKSYIYNLLSKAEMNICD